MKIFIIIPVYNEEKRAVETICAVLKEDKTVNVIVIDDGSTDKSLDILKCNFKNNNRVVITNHVVNLGKGAAMKTGMQIAWKLGGEAIIFIDADGQHNPKYLPIFIRELEKSPIVFGYRELNKESPWIRRFGNIFAER